MNPIDKVNHVKVFSPVLSGLIYAFIVMLAGTIVTSFILLLSAAEERSLSTFSFITHIVSLLAGGWVAGRKSGTKGWYFGGVLGGIYALIIFMIAFLAFDAGLTMRSAVLLGMCLASAAIGGIFGVNSKK
jgi:putative membrane protein (TIGR04086 family)